MKKSFLLFLIFPMFGFGQFTSKVNFENLSWSQAIAKAKKEHKNIFIDGYTTWCVWCRWLDNRIFTDSTVGEELNKNFISLKIQFDSSQKDNSFIKSWYAEAKRMIKDYDIRSYPTQLFFDSNGEILHKVVGVDSKGGVLSYLSVIDKSMNPNLQYYKVLREIKNNKNNANLYKNLSLGAFYAGEYKTSDYALKKYLRLTNNGDWSKEKISFLVKMSHSEKDTSYTILKENEKKFDDITKDPISSDAIRTIIYYDELERIIFREKGQIENYRYYLKEPDWNILRVNLEKKYSNKLSEGVIEYAKLQFYKDQYNWSKYFPILNLFVKNYEDDISSETYSNFAKTILIYSNDKLILKQGIDLINQSLDLCYSTENEIIKNKLIEKYESL